MHPCDESSLRGPIEAAELGIIKPILVGPAAKIKKVAGEHGIKISGLEVIDAPHSEAAAERAVELVHEGKGELLMKGSLHTDELMRCVTASGSGLRTNRRISHVFVMDVPTYAETLFITDGAINIFPDLDAKRSVEGDDADWRRILPLEQVADQRGAVVSPVASASFKNFAIIFGWS